MIFKQKKNRKIIGFIREEIFTYQYENGHFDKAMIRTFYKEEKDIVIISPLNSYGFQNILECFAHMAVYFHDLDSKNTIFIEHRPPFCAREEQFSIFTCEIPNDTNFYRNNFTADWIHTFDKGQLEELLKCKFTSPFIKFIPFLKYEERIRELRLFLIPHTMSSVKSVDGRYDIKIERGTSKPFINHSNFIKSMKYTEVICKRNQFNILHNNIRYERDIENFEHFYKIGENFVNMFDGETFNCFIDIYSNYIITKTDLTELIAKNLKRIVEESKYEFKEIEIRDVLYTEIKQMVNYLLSNTIDQPIFNILPLPNTIWFPLKQSAYK